jgi:hypothetical protein
MIFIVSLHIKLGTTSDFTWYDGDRIETRIFEDLEIHYKV